MRTFKNLSEHQFRTFCAIQRGVQSGHSKNVLKTLTNRGLIKKYNPDAFSTAFYVPTMVSHDFHKWQRENHA